MSGVLRSWIVSVMHRIFYFAVFLAVTAIAFGLLVTLDRIIGG
jgi:hypothetical protein